jgi:phosphatidyl-myo-inositol alpha-mannosyltransferase
MNIVHFISHFPYPEQRTDPWLIEHYVCSGGEWAAFHLVTEQAKAGHTVTVLASSVRRVDEADPPAAFGVRRYGSRLRVGDTLLAPGMFFRPPRQLPAPDVVHIHHTTPPGGMAGLSCNRTWRRPLVVTHHGFEKPDSYGSPVRRLAVFLSAEYYVNPLLRSAARIICLSPIFPKQSRFLGAYAAKTVFIPNGADLTETADDLSQVDARRELNLPPGRRYILYLGSLIPPKGLGVLLRAMPGIRAEFDDADLLVVGQGPAEAEFRRQAGELQLADSVRFRGFVGDPRRKSLYYRSADVLVLPTTLSEMFPLVLLEGAAAGCAMVASDLEIFRWFFAEGSGVITPAGDPAALEAAIRGVLREPSRREALRRKVHRRAAEFSWPAIASQTLDVYRALLAEGRPGGAG